jgi:hypothetical protein
MVGWEDVGAIRGYDDVRTVVVLDDMRAIVDCDDVWAIVGVYRNAFLPILPIPIFSFCRNECRYRYNRHLFLFFLCAFMSTCLFDRPKTSGHI